MSDPFSPSQCPLKKTVWQFLSLSQGCSLRQWWFLDPGRVGETGSTGRKCFWERSFLKSRPPATWRALRTALTSSRLPEAGCGTRGQAQRLEWEWGFPSFLSFYSLNSRILSSSLPCPPNATEIQTGSRVSYEPTGQYNQSPQHTAVLKRSDSTCTMNYWLKKKKKNFTEVYLICIKVAIM